MRQTAIPIFEAKTRALEGVIPWPYLDTRRIVTIGIGHAVESRAEWLSLPFDLDPLQSPATSYAYFDLVWSLLHSLSFGPDLAAGWYASKSTLRLTDQAISALFQSDVTKLETYAGGIFSGYDDYGCDAQMGSMSMIFALGPGGIHGFPRCCAAIRAGDWATAADQCHMQGCSAARNEFTRSCFLAAAAHQDHLDAVQVI
jgi:GH24 family phage-related lysozyme (muramidase)